MSARDKFGDDFIARFFIRADMRKSRAAAEQQAVMRVHHAAAGRTVYMKLDLVETVQHRMRPPGDVRCKLTCKRRSGKCISLASFYDNRLRHLLVGRGPAEMLDVAQIEFNDRHDDEQVRRAELTIDDRAVADLGTATQIALYQWRQRGERAALIDAVAVEHLHRHMPGLERAHVPFL